MKKLTKIFIFLFAFVLIVPTWFSAKLTASAKVNNQVVGYSTFSGVVSKIINDYSGFTEREPGSEGEKKASEYIHAYLEDETSLEAYEDAYIKDGIQSFKFESKFSGAFENSQNIIYTLKAANKTDKKVILGCHYDAIAFDLNTESETYGELIGSQSVNGSAGNVATLLALAKYLPANNLEFNVEFVFFGAGESNNAGSDYYTKGISDEDKKNILCMINMNQIAFGENLYFYMNEISTKASDFVADVVYENRVEIEQVNVSHLNKTTAAQNDVLGLGYSHVALDSDNVNFMREEIPAINIFSGNYSEGVVIGRQEMNGKDLLTYTINDNISYILENYETYSIEENLYNVYKAVTNILTDADFVKVFEAEQGKTNWFYAIFANETLVFYLTIVAFIIFVIVAMYIYYRLSIKAYHANVEMEFLSSVMKITEGLDKGEKTDEVAKIVTQVVANDIKKDKVIKVKSTKKDKRDNGDEK